MAKEKISTRHKIPPEKDHGAENKLWRRENPPPAKDYGAEKKGYSEEVREHTPVCDRTHEEQGSPFYARKPKPGSPFYTRKPQPGRQRITEENLGAQNEPQGSLLNASDRGGQTGGLFLCS